MSETHLYSVPPETRPDNFNNFSNFTMGPNWLYDQVAVHESPSVLKVLLFFNRNTTGRTGPDGKRVEVVQASYSWIARCMQMSERAVQTAMHTVLAKGYLIQVKPGRLGTATNPAEGGWYKLNWEWAGVDNVSYVNFNKKPQKVKIPSKPDPWDESQPNGQEQPEQNLPGEPAQNLPEDTAQDLPPCINKASDLNKRVEIKPRALRRNNSTGEKSQKSVREPDRLTVIGRLVSDFGREFGDKPELTLPNISRAVNLWRKSGLAEQEFVKLLYQARQRTQARSDIKQRRLAANGAASNLPNRMPYFFAVLEELTTGPKVAPSPQAKKRPAPSKIEAAPEVAEDYVPVEDGKAEPVPVIARKPAVQVEVWEKVCQSVANLPEQKQLALRRAYLSQIEDRTRARFELKFARSWEKDLFNSTDWFQLEVALGRVLGKVVYEIRPG